MTLLRIPLFVRGRAERASATKFTVRSLTPYQHPKGDVFANPLPTPARIAVLARLFEERNGVRCFEPDAVAEIQGFHPQILAGSVHALLKLSGEIRGLRALVVFSGARVGSVSAGDRDLLWRAFQLPVFEQRFAVNGRVVARECEAHDGLHITGNAGFDETLLNGPCECGRDEARIGFATAD